MKYLLDTNTCIYLLKNYINVVEKYKSNMQFGIAVSSITTAELYYGVYNSANPEKNGSNLIKFFTGFKTLNFDDFAAAEYGRIRVELRRKGTPVGPLNLMIAAHAKSKDLIVVTNNVKEFGHIDNLLIENWDEDSNTIFK